ncbi:ribose transport system ATP-binding protein [Actinomadura coerulea]|uniref:Ribose transport system ATP-binding protein n=1 Tax=Actinomadura coerulea TaxID=46159 RepID=A0A7X0FXS0_9ACTN|nr:sugar ABC transporter ATP-binding protein [Actinomadura coerulea]MBB6395709.1 ribose transport system ATP-binding protein [Actinomadura coerulea]GGQ26566.1 sugar ABC transporter ATP-binding protein [Actinomadura coerulea]
MTEPALRVDGLTKSFLGQTVLNGVDLRIAPGEIHALLGENGAGKSTLIKILAGVHAADAGRVTVAGRPLRPRHRLADAAAARMRFVHQDLGLVDELDVTENICLTSDFSSRGGLIRFGASRRRVREVLGRLGVDIDPGRRVGDLAQAEKVMVAVARAFSAEARLIVLDEVTASLPTPEVARLKDLLHQACRQGTAFLFVTHRLGEVFDMADAVTVLRDGRRIASARPADVTHDQLVEWLVGRYVAALAPRSGESHASAGTPVLRVKDLRATPHHAPLNFTVGAGEVVAFTGLVGSGAREVVRCLAGAQRPQEGTASLRGRRFPLGDPVGAAGRGSRYVAGDRQEGIAPDLCVRENLFLAHYCHGGRVLRPRRERRAADDLIARYDVRPPQASELPVVTLSGGNQQKVAIGRALSGAPGLLVLDDPTVGVDIGARVAIHRLIRQTADTGVPVVLASTDFSEVVSEAHRAVVMRDGRVGAVLSGADLTEQRLISESYRAREVA